MRVYLPATLPLVRELLETGSLPPGMAFAVTPTLREFFAEGDEDELEYAALIDAAQASLRLLDADLAAPRRRVVLAADVPDTAARPLAPDAGERSAVEVRCPVQLSQVVSGHVDDAAAEGTVAAAAAAVIAADLGSDDAQFAVDEAEGHELGWFATQELGPLIELG